MVRSIAARAAYSYRDDPAVPAFPDDHPLIVFDGVCVLCSRAMRDIAIRDRSGRYHFTACQSTLGAALMRHYGLDPDNPDTVLLIDNGRACGKLDMAAKLAGDLGGPWLLFGLLRGLPRSWQDWCYDRVAKNRYHWFGRREACIVPDPAWRARVIG